MTASTAALHHWWPKTVSKRWVADDGFVGCVGPDGRVHRSASKNWGPIRRGHTVKLIPDSASKTEWDLDFESDFDAADRNFSALIDWLETCHRTRKGGSLRERFEPIPATDDQLRMLTECVVSLAVRSPLHRASSLPWLEPGSTWRTQRDEEILIRANMVDNQRRFAEHIGTRAKFAVLHAEGGEFIFGDGFFQNLHGHVPPHDPRVMVPLTPALGVIIYRPFSMLVEPKLSSIVLSESEVLCCNQVVQFYSKDQLFFRSQKPTLVDEFKRGEHLEVPLEGSFIKELFDSIPGVQKPNTRLF